MQHYSAVGHVAEVATLVVSLEIVVVFVWFRHSIYTSKVVKMEIVII